MKRSVLAFVFAAALGFHALPALAASAIAVDDEAGDSAGSAGYGVGGGESAAEANKEALKNCRESGNKSCKIVLTYAKCGAYASSKNEFGTGEGATEAAASAAAMEACGKGCKLVVSDCN